MTDHQRDAEEAGRIVTSEIFKRAFAELESNIVSRLATPSLTPEQIITTQHELVAHRRVERWLKQLVLTGQMEAMAEQQKRVTTKSRKLL